MIEFYKLSDRINSLGYTRNFAGSIVLVIYTLGASLIDLGSSSNQCSLLPGESLLLTGGGQHLQLITFDDAEQFHAIENKLMRR